MCWPGGQHHLLGVNEVGSVKRCEFKSVAVCDRVRGACLHAVSAKNAPVVIDVVNPGEALGATDTVLRGIFGCFDVNAVGGAIRRAQKAGDTLFQAVLVALQNVGPSVAGFNPGTAQRVFTVGIILDNRRLEHLGKRDAHSLSDCGDILQH